MYLSLILMCSVTLCQQQKKLAQIFLQKPVSCSVTCLEGKHGCWNLGERENRMKKINNLCSGGLL